jgi:transposase InsO family protein
MVLRELAGPWQRIAIDVLSGFNKSKNGNNLLLVVMDEYTKWPEVIPLKDQKSETIAEALVQHVFYRHGLPVVIHSDQAKNLGLSAIQANVCDLLGISRSFSSPYHPEGNGMVERFNRFLVAGLYCLMNREQDDWDRQVPALLFAYRTAIHATTGETPFFLNYGRDPRLPGDLLVNEIKLGTQSQKNYARTILEQQTKIQSQIHDLINLERHKMKERSDRDKKKKDVEFKVGDPDDDDILTADLVSIYYQEPHVVGNSTKFRSTWSLPFRVIRKISSVNYEVQSLRDATVKKIVHVSRMRKFHPWERISKSDPTHVDITSPLPGFEEGSNAPERLFPCEDFEISKILDQYVEGKRSWFLVEWVGYEQPSWEAEENINAKALLTEWKKNVRSMPRDQRGQLGVHPSKRPRNDSDIPLIVEGLPQASPDIPTMPVSQDTPAEDISSKRRRRRRRS